VFLLGGIILAIIVFVLIILLFSNGNGGTSGGTPAPVTQLDTVYATKDIPIGTQVTSDMVGTHKVDVASRPSTAFANVSNVVGQIIRAPVVANTDLNASMFASSGIVASITPSLDKGQRGMSVQVDQVTGAGTLIQAGDHVDAIIGFGGSSGTCGTGFKLANIDPKTGQVTEGPALGGASIKTIVQNIKVVGTLLPTPTAAPAAASNGTTTTAPTGTALNGQQEIVLMSVTAQQAEVLRYGQVDGCLSLVLRSPKDYVDTSKPPNPIIPPPDATTGVILKTLVDQYGVLPPQIIQAVLPKK
jgi:Flp pilus assembly protein CpaB